MKRLIAVPAVALLLALVACSPIQEGQITEKHKSGDYWYTTYTQQCISYDKNAVCTSWISIPQQNYMPPSWRFDLTDGEQNGWVGVNKATFDEYEVGDYYPKGVR